MFLLLLSRSRQCTRLGLPVEHGSKVERATVAILVEIGYKLVERISEIFGAVDPLLLLLLADFLLPEMGLVSGDVLLDSSPNGFFPMSVNPGTIASGAAAMASVSAVFAETERESYRQLD